MSAGVPPVQGFPTNSLFGKKIANSITPNDADRIGFVAVNNRWEPLAGGGLGEANTSLNVGVGGVDINLAKAGVNLPKKSMFAVDSTHVSVVDGGANNRVEFDTGTAVVLNDQSNTYGLFDQIFRDNSIKIRNPLDTFQYTIQGGAITANRTISLPAVAASDDFVLRFHPETLRNKTFIGSINQNFFEDNALIIQNPANTFNYTFQSAAIVAARTITLPLLAGPDTAVMEAFAQPIINKTIDANSNTITNIGSSETILDLITGQTLKASPLAADEILINSIADGAFRRATIGSLPVGSDTPWTVDHVAAGFDFNDLSNLEFRETTLAPAGSVRAIWNDSVGMKINSPSGRNIILSINGVTEMTVTNVATILAGSQLAVIDGFFIRWASNSQRQILNNTTGTFYEVAAAQGHFVQVANVTEYDYDATRADFLSNNLINAIFPGVSPNQFEDDGLVIQNPANTFNYLIQSSAIVAARTITLPLLAGPDTAVMEAFAQPITNKTFDANSNTLTNVGFSEVIADIITGQTAITLPVQPALDEVLIHDSSASALRRVLVEDIQKKLSAVLTAAGAIIGSVSNPTKTTVSGANHVYSVLDYPNGSTTEAFWDFRMPSDIGTNLDLTFVIRWISTATTGDVDFEAAILGRSDSEAWDIALTNPTIVTVVTDAVAGDLNTTTITINTSGIDEDDDIIVRIRRLGAADTMTANARLLSCRMLYA